MASPFARANMMMAAIAEAMSMTNVGQRTAAMAAIEPYQSRGKGRGGRGAKQLGGSTRSKYRPHIGAKEQERAKRCYMSTHHAGGYGDVRSQPTLCQIAKPRVRASIRDFDDTSSLISF